MTMLLFKTASAHIHTHTHTHTHTHIYIYICTWPLTFSVSQSPLWYLL